MHNGLSLLQSHGERLTSEEESKDRRMLLVSYKDHCLVLSNSVFNNVLWQTKSTATKTILLPEGEVKAHADLGVRVNT